MAAGTLCRFLGIRASSILRSWLQCGSHRSRPRRRYIVVVASHTTKIRNTTVLINDRGLYRVSVGYFEFATPHRPCHDRGAPADQPTCRAAVPLILASVFTVDVLGELRSRSKRSRTIRGWTLVSLDIITHTLTYQSNRKIPTSLASLTNRALLDHLDVG